MLHAKKKAVVVDTEEQLLAGSRELRPAAGTEELRTILNRAGGDFNAALALLGADTPAEPPTNQATVRTVEQVRADRLLGVESVARVSGRSAMCVTPSARSAAAAGTRFSMKLNSVL